MKSKKLSMTAAATIAVAALASVTACGGSHQEPETPTNESAPSTPSGNDTTTGTGTTGTDTTGTDTTGSGTTGSGTDSTGTTGTGTTGSGSGTPTPPGGSGGGGGSMPH